MIDVVIPFRWGDPWRQRLLEHVEAKWIRAGFRPIVGGTTEGPWVKADAVAVGMRDVVSDVVVVADADVWCDPAVIGQAIAACGGKWSWAVPHRQVRRLAQTPTQVVLAGHEPNTDMVLERRAYLGHQGGGIVVLRREVWDQTPLDPRFQGWGQEDDAWATALRTMHGSCWRGAADLFHLWHPTQERKSDTIGSEASWLLYRRYVAASSRPSAMRKLLAETSVSVDLTL